ncbi:hypothetical protein LMH73_018295 [Vibrio splendidus]
MSTDRIASCHDAINKSTMFIRRYGLEHVVDMDLSKCFDKLDMSLSSEVLERESGIVVYWH